MRRRFLAADPATPTAVLVQTADDLPAALADRDAHWAYLRFVPTPEQIKQAHKAGKNVIVVGVSVPGLEPDNWQKVREADADAILTDYPLECRRGGCDRGEGPADLARALAMPESADQMDRRHPATTSARTIGSGAPVEVILAVRHETVSLPGLANPASVVLRLTEAILHATPR